MSGNGDRRDLRFEFDRRTAQVIPTVTHRPPPQTQTTSTPIRRRAIRRPARGAAVPHTKTHTHTHNTRDARSLPSDVVCDAIVLARREALHVSAPLLRATRRPHDPIDLDISTSSYLLRDERVAAEDNELVHPLGVLRGEQHCGVRAVRPAHHVVPGRAAAARATHDRARRRRLKRTRRREDARARRAVRGGASRDLLDA